MRTRGPFARFLLALGAGICGLLVVAGGLGLWGPGLVAVAVAGAVAAALAAGVARESGSTGRRGAAAAAWLAAAWTVGLLMLISGIAYHLMFMRGLRQLRETMKEEDLIHGESSFPASFTLVVAVLLLIVGLLAIASITFRLGPFL